MDIYFINTLSIHVHIRWNLGAHAPSWATLQWGWSPMVEGFGTPGLTGTSNWPDELLWRSVILIVCLRKWVGWSVDARLLTKSNWFLWKMFGKPVWFTANYLSLFFPLLSSSFLFFPSPFLFHCLTISVSHRLRQGWCTGWCTLTNLSWRSPTSASTWPEISTTPSLPTRRITCTSDNYQFKWEADIYQLFTSSCSRGTWEEDFWTVVATRLHTVPIPCSPALGCRRHYATDISVDV